MTDYRNKIDMLRIGDIMLAKTESKVGWRIREFLPPSPLNETTLAWLDRIAPAACSNHNGVFGTDKNDNLVIFESNMGGFTATPIEHYIDEVKQGKSALKFARYPDWQSQHLAFINRFCQSNIGKDIGYDWLAFISHALNLYFGAHFNLHFMSRWYCTEFIHVFCEKLVDHFCDENLDWLKNPLPTPYTIEKRLFSGVLFQIVEFN